MSTTTKHVNVLRYKQDDVFYEEDIVVKEVPLTVCCNNVQLATLLCTPEHEKELATGFLYASGLIWDKERLIEVIHNDTENSVFIKYKDDEDRKNVALKRFMTTGCGMGMLLASEDEIATVKKYNGDVSLNAENIVKLMKELQQRSELYLTTGGVHSAALSDGREILVFREDIGRHNAVDKIIGYSFLKGIPLHDKVLFTSGRISSEIVIKVAKVGLGFIVSRSAPMDRAVEFAKSLNMTVIGFARAKRMNIYCGEERLLSF